MGTDELARPVTVAIVEDHEFVIKGIQAAIDQEPNRRMTVVATGSTIDAVLGAGGSEADVIILDLCLGKDMVTDRIAELADHGLRVVVLSNFSGFEYINAAMAAGACTYLTKDETAEHCLDAIFTVASDYAYIPPALAGVIRVADPGLRPQEKEVLLLLYEGLAHKQIARRLGINERMVRRHIDAGRARYARVGRPCRSNLALVARGIEDGLVRPEDVGRPPRQRIPTTTPSEREHGVANSTNQNPIA